MIFRNSYCRFCSADRHDYRTLVVEKHTIKCENCGKMLYQIPAGDKSPYYYLEEMPRYARRRPE